MTVYRMDHAGVVVEDLAAAIAFFVELGLELEGEAAVEGEWVDQLVGLDGVGADIAAVRTPDGHGTSIELSTTPTYKGAESERQRLGPTPRGLRKAHNQNNAIEHNSEEEGDVVELSFDHYRQRAPQPDHPASQPKVHSSRFTNAKLRV